MSACEHGYAEGACTVCETARLRKENDILRAIASKVMPCHYCGVASIGKCPHGFPGCSLADDMMAGDECMSAEIQKLRREVKNANEIADAARQGAQLGPLIGAQTILEQEIKIKALERELGQLKKAVKA